MRRFSLVACATAIIATGIFAGVNESATAARKPSSPLASTTIRLVPNETNTACVLTVSWVPNDPQHVLGYIVRSDDAPVSAKSTSVQAKTTNETTASWEFADYGAFYMDITVTYDDGRSSKPWSMGYPAWNCL